MAKTQAECDPNKPDEAFAWMFAAGVPDPRLSGKYPNQPLISPACWPAFSEMLWKMGARFHPELQELWVEPSEGPMGNFTVCGTTTVKPEEIEGHVAEMVVDQFPEIAQQISRVTPDTHSEALQAQASKLMSSLERLRAASRKFERAEGGDADGGDA